MSVGVWHSAQPTLANRLLPRPIESAPPGVSGEGVGGARKRWKFAKFWIAGGAGERVGRVEVLRVVRNRRELACRVLLALSFWNSSLVMPISTL